MSRIDDLEDYPKGFEQYGDTDVMEAMLRAYPDLVAFVREIQSLHVPNENCYHGGWHCCRECELLWPCASRKAIDRLNGEES